MPTIDLSQGWVHTKNGLKWLATRLSRLLLAAAGIIVLVFLAKTWIGDPFGSPPTLGTIWVDTPEIYTRERLVNDRFIQDAWLNRKLDSTNDILDSLQVIQDQRAALLEHGNSPDRSHSENTGDVTPRQSSRDQLLAELDYRDLVRNLAIENQLDDRHDLNGNSLFRFKFDASIAPGNNTQATAVILVRLSGPFTTRPLDSGAHPDSQRMLSELGTKEDRKRWRSIYARWIESLRSRLNQTHRELKQGYASNEFSHNDYVRFIAFLRRNLQQQARSTPSCPPAIASIQHQENEPTSLTTKDHGIRKECVQKIIEANIKRKTDSAAHEARVFDSAPYIVKKDLEVPAAPPPSSESLDALTQSVQRELDRWLNVFFAGKSIQLVLGISVPEFAFIGQAFYNVPALEKLAKLTFFSSQPSPDDGNVFLVTQKVLTVEAIDRDRVSEKRFKDIVATSQALVDEEFDEFIALDTVASDRLLVSQKGLDSISGEGYRLVKEDFVPVPGVDGVYSATVELGLLNFARKARVHAQAFSYAVTPKESADTVASTLTSDSKVAASGALEGMGPTTVTLARGWVARAVARRGSVVGFGSASGDPGVAEFGWIIGPRIPAMDGQRLTYVQGVGQYALSALVSIPSWWNEVTLNVTPYWIGLDGKEIQQQKKTSQSYRVEVPTDFEPLEAALLEVPQLGPELMESRLDPIMLTACQRGAIVIPGRRLWRSTRVTLGYQSADEISVLPNMKGIVAIFRTVRNQMTVTESKLESSEHGARHLGTEIKRPVRVWTSQGTITLPNAARIGIPARCQEGRQDSSRGK